MTLTIIKEQDAGTYEVKATNMLGSVESKSVVTVISKYSGCVATCHDSLYYMELG